MAATDYEDDCTPLNRTSPANSIHSLRAQCAFCETRWTVPARAAFGQDHAACRACGMVQVLKPESPDEAYFSWVRAGGPAKRPTPIRGIAPRPRPPLPARVAAGGVDL